MQTPFADLPPIDVATDESLISATPDIQITLTASQDEVNQAIEALNAAGMTEFAQLLAQAIPSDEETAMNNESASLQRDMIAMQPRE